MDTTLTFNLYSPGRASLGNQNGTVLAADLRKERSVLALYKIVDGKFSLEAEKSFCTGDFGSFQEMAKAFAGEKNTKFSRVSVAVPGPVIFGRCETVNLPWALDSEEIKNEISAEKVFLINDMEATAYSLSDLSKAEVVAIHDSEKVMPGNVALLAPGNGLGEAGLFWDGSSLRPFATEGGHTEFSPRNEFEVEFYQYLNKIYGIVSWENVLSKDGVYNIYRFLRDVGRHEEGQEISAKLHSGNFTENLAECGLEGKSKLVKLTLEMFAEFLAREANYLSLKLKSTGGLIITGEVAEVLRAFIDKEKFYRDFKISDKMEILLKDIPIYFIFNKNAILEGAAHYGAFVEE